MLLVQFLLLITYTNHLVWSQLSRNTACIRLSRLPCIVVGIRIEFLIVSVITGMPVICDVERVYICMLCMRFPRTSLQAYRINLSILSCHLPNVCVLCQHFNCHWTLARIAPPFVYTLHISNIFVTRVRGRFSVSYHVSALYGLYSYLYYGIHSHTVLTAIFQVVVG